MDLKTKQHELGELINEKKTLRIPSFQRNFSWTKDKWSDLIEDLRSSIINTEDHFFGFMTLKEIEDNSFEIIEGQQRLTTVTILLCVMRDLCAENGLSDAEDKIQRVITKRHRRSRRPLKNTNRNNAVYNLTLSRLNNDLFRKVIQDEYTQKEKQKRFVDRMEVTQSNILIYKCYQYFHNEITETIKGISPIEKEEIIFDYFDSLLDNFILIVTYVKDTITAYNIFQTLNDRGQKLALSDILKIHICKHVKEDNVENFIERYWDSIQEEFSGDMSKFLRHYWLSSKGVVPRTKLLGVIKQSISSEDGAYNFLEILSDEVKPYEALLNPTAEYWDRKDNKKEVFGLLDDLKILGNVIPLPLLLSASIMIDINEFIKIIEYIISFQFRYLTIAEKESKVLEKLFSDIAIEIRLEKITTADQVKNKLIPEDISNEYFIASLKDKDIKKPNVATYILKKIEKYPDKSKEIFNDEITLEHILPKKPDKEWENYMKENNMEQSQLVHKLGNLTLLLGKVNSKLQNRLYSKKTKVYQQSSQLKMNKDLSNMKSWNAKDIRSRSEALAKECVKIWKL